MKINLPKLRFNNPMSFEKIAEVISLLDLDSTDRVVDFGGGNGEVLLEILKRGGKGVLIDTNSKLLDECKANSGDLVEQGKLELVNKEAREWLKDQEASSIDCAVCIGSSHAFEGYQNLITEVKPYLKPNGLFIIGEGFWMEKPNPEYLKALGSDESELMFHYENIDVAEKLGLRYSYSNVASEDDWNKWEGTYFLDKELEHSKNETPEGLKKLEGTRDFRRAQIQYGRKIMGFGLYLFGNKESTPA